MYNSGVWSLRVFWSLASVLVAGEVGCILALVIDCIATDMLLL